MKTPLKRLMSVLLVMLCAVLVIPQNIALTQTAVAAVTAADYPVSLVQIGTADGGSSLSASGAKLTTAANSGAIAQSFRIDYVGADGNGSYFRIVSAASGKAVAVNGSACTLVGTSNDKSQLWYISAVQNDTRGQGLYYKIVSCANTSNALTNNNGEVGAAAYSGSNSQKWLLNSAGLQGFAGYGKDIKGNVKASTIGGLLGEVVEVTTFDELKNACEKDDKPRTIIVTKNISKTGTYSKTDAGRYYWFGGTIYVHDNKTIIGSYNAHELYNVNFGSQNRDGYGRANNVIIRNIEISHDKDLNHHNVWDFADGYNCWIDHCTFVGHAEVNKASSGQVDWDKFLCFYDGSDYVTISDCNFGRHKYGVLLGWPGDSEANVAQYDGIPCITLADNYFHETLTRAPGLLRYGYFHSLNNFVYNFDMGYTIYTDSKLYAEKCYYDAGSQKGSVVNDSTSTGDASSKYPGKYTEEGSIHANGGKLTNGQSSPCTWRPSSNYSYKSMTAQEAKNYTVANSGAKSSPDKMEYFCLDHNWAMEITAEEGAVLDTSKTYAFRNVGSGLFLEVENGTAASGTNVMQGKSDNRNADMWTLQDAGDGYYYLYTKADANGGLCLDLPYGSADNGTSLGIWTNDKSDARKFKFIDNGDGSYTIVTKSSDDGSCVAVASDSKESGADVIQWTRNGGDAQKWVAVVKYELLSGELIKDFDRLDSEHGDSWSVESDLKIGSLLFGDRDVTYAEIPDELVGAEYIKTACDAKGVATDLGEFTAAQDCTVYVALDSRMPTAPAWLGSWTKTDLTVKNSNNVSFDLYAKEVKASEKVVLGANNYTQSVVNYTVIAVKAEEKIIKGNVNADGEFSVADLVMMQNFLLGKGTLTDWQAGDLCEDGRIDVFDMVMMRKLLIEV